MRIQNQERASREKLFTSIFLLSVAMTASASDVIVWGSNSSGQNTAPDGATNVISLVGGDYHFVTLRADGTALGWGYQPYSSNFFQGSATNLVAIAAGSSHILTLSSNGAIQQWGYMWNSALPPASATNIVAIAKGAGAQHAVALRSDGSLFDWGNNSAALLTPPPEATNVVSVSVGAYHGVALRADGRVVAWGDNSYGQITVPPSATNIVAISSGWYHNAAIRSDGSVITWGSTSPFYGGGGSLVPIPMFDALDVASGGNHVLVLKRDGSVVAWGNNSFGQLTIPPEVTQIAAIGGSSYNSMATIGSGAPAFATPAIDRRVADGQTAYFRMLAAGKLPLRYKWSCNGTNISDATNSVLIVSNASLAQSGNLYSVTASNDLGYAISSPMMLQVEPLQVTVSPRSSIVLRGGGFTLGANVIGTGPFSFQWIFNGTNLPGATGSSLALTNVDLNLSGHYSCAVSNLLGGAIAGADVSVVAILVTNQPSGGTVAAGTNVILSVAAAGEGPISYQWQLNETNLLGATSSSLELMNIQTNQTGSYRCVLSNSFGTATSSRAFLTVLPLRISSLYGQTVAAGSNVTFTVAITGQGPFAYQWQLNGTNIAGAIDATLILPTVQLEQSGNYSCVVSNVYGSAQSSTAKLTVLPFIVTAAPTDQTAVVEGNATFTIAATSVAPLSYQWQLNGTNIVDGTNASLVLTNIQAGYAGVYSCVLSNVYGESTNSATLTIVPLLITAQPTGRTVNGGVNTTFSVTVTGKLPVTYQWRFEGTNIANATNGSLTLNNVQMSQDGWYSVVASNQYGSVESTPAKLTVVPFTVLTQPISRTVLAGTSTSFSVAVTGKSPFTYQWQSNGTNIPGKTSFGLTLSPVQVSHAGIYSVIVSNSFGSVTTPIATLEVTPLTITSHPASRTILAGSNTTFTVAASGQQPIRYQWFYDGNQIPDATNTWLTVSNVPLNGSGGYWAGVSNPYLSLTSKVAQLTVQSLQFASALQNTVIFRGGTANLSVTVNSSVPVQFQWQFNGTNISGATNSILTISNIQYAQAGTYSIAIDNTLVLTNSSASVAVVPVAAWGDNTYGQTYIPPTLSNVLAIAAGGNHWLMLLSNGTVTAWGQNWSGQTSVPAGLSNVVAIAAGLSHSVALRADGTVTAWGDNFYGQCAVPIGLSNVVQISSKNLHTLALTSDGHVYAWGDDGSGQSTIPLNLSNVVAVAAGGSHSLALCSDGSIAAWGSNDQGQSTIPPSLTNVAAISAGIAHSVALQSNGVVRAWGADWYGVTNVPPELDKVTAVDAGHYHNIAVRTDGTAAAWGYNVHLETQLPAGLSNVIEVAGGLYHSMALVGDKPSVMLSRAFADGLRRDASGFSLSIPSLSGHVYRLEFRNSLSDQNWIALPLVAGNGGSLTLTDSFSTNAARFYRVRKW